MCNEYGVPYCEYELKLSDGSEIVMDIGEEEDWGNVQRCFKRTRSKKLKECVGWGCEDDWTEVVDVFDCETETHLDPMKWAEERVWCYVGNYSC